MTNNTDIIKVAEFLEREFSNRTGDISVFKNEDGSYELFNRYFIVPDKNKNFTVVIKHTDSCKVFSSLKVAVTWCIFESRRQIRESHRIEELDALLSGLDFSISLHKKLIKSNKDMEKKLIQVAKLSEDQLRKKSMQDELIDYIKNSIYWQKRRFSLDRVK